MTIRASEISSPDRLRRPAVHETVAPASWPAVAWTSWSTLVSLSVFLRGICALLTLHEHTAFPHSTQSSGKHRPCTTPRASLPERISTRISLQPAPRNGMPADCTGIKYQLTNMTLAHIIVKSRFFCSIIPKPALAPRSAFVRRMRTGRAAVGLVAVRRERVVSKRQG